MSQHLSLVDEAALRAVIAQLDLDDAQKDRLNKRWLHYVLWWDERANENKWKYRVLRGIVIIGGATVPALVSLHVADPRGAAGLHILTVVISLLVAISAGLEGFFGYGEIWREKRAAAEILKVQGWRFFNLIRPYAGKTHREAFPDFADAVETMIEHEVKDYLVATQGDVSSQSTKAQQPGPPAKQ
jgi:uncharacterized protein DUF4231